MSYAYSVSALLVLAASRLRLLSSVVEGTTGAELLWTASNDAVDGEEVVLGKT